MSSFRYVLSPLVAADTVQTFHDSKPIHFMCIPNTYNCFFNTEISHHAVIKAYVLTFPVLTLGASPAGYSSNSRQKTDLGGCKCPSADGVGRIQNGAVRFGRGELTLQHIQVEVGVAVAGAVPIPHFLCKRTSKLPTKGL